MASRQSRLEAEKLHLIQKSISRGRSTSPSGNGNRSRSGSEDEFNKELKWSITNHDPSERIVHKDSAIPTETDWENEISEEEHLSDDDNQENFQYDDTGNILPNYACHDEQINEISHILESSNLDDKDTIRRLEELTASERAIANAKTVGNHLDEDIVSKVREDKQRLTGENALDLNSLDQDALTRKQKLENYQSYRKKIIHQENEHNKKDADVSKDASKSSKENGSDNSDDAVTELHNENGEDFMVPYTSAVEDKLDSEFASQLNETIREGEVDSNRNHSRVIQTITRGNFFQLINPKVKPKMFLVCMDFSPESIFALEWCLGTVLVDGSVLFIVCVIEETDSNHNLKGSTATESSREQYRLHLLNRAKQQILNLLKLTKLQIHIVIEIVHHPIPRHLILELIDNLQPTLVVVGSKGQSAIKGVLLGSLSNYLVTKSSVPVMVVREKLKKINRFKSGSSVFSNNIKSLTLSEARID
jgi:nucleotide-binding universal stress UspA family protein